MGVLARRILLGVSVIPGTACYTGLGATDRADSGQVNTDGPAIGSDSGAGTTGDDGVPEPMDDPPAPGMEFECEGSVQDPGPYLARRLNRDEYIASVQAVVGVDTNDLRDRLPIDLRADDFTNTAQALIVSTDDVEQFASIAEDVVNRMADFAAFMSAHTSCTDFTDLCQDEFIRNVGLKFYRRPVEEAERAQLATLFALSQTEGDGFEDGAKAVVQSLLQSPRFLYRIEGQDDAGGATFRTLDGYEVASKLSYLVIGAGPDDALMSAAAEDQLSTVDQRRAQVERLFQDPRARTTARRYLADWLHLDRLSQINEDDAIKAAVREEAEAFFDAMVWEEDRPLVELFNARFTMASGVLAQEYGFDVQGEGVERYDLDGVGQRRGLLTSGAYLSWKEADASMVFRGLFVIQHVLCTDVGSVPPGVNDSPPEIGPNSTRRDHAEERGADPKCGACHAVFEPIAFAFEQYDPIGRWSDVDEFGNELRSDGVLHTQFQAEPVAFADALELAEALAAEPRTRDCQLLKVGQFALGRPVVVSDGCTLSAIREQVASGGTYRDVIEAIASQPSFGLTRVE